MACAVRDGRLLLVLWMQIYFSAFISKGRLSPGELVVAQAGGVDGFWSFCSVFLRSGHGPAGDGAVLVVGVLNGSTRK
jgi:hypothetical protein